ncbi:unnamed protein product [Citrullus colocynthis]|uniref:Uncharacterized protein n=1 Tax=Citrullus colocynthis TaxID=252529 RepID=A0ABP0XXI9_9ROSI
MYKYKKEKKEDSQAKAGKQWRSKAGSLYPYLPDKAISRFISILQTPSFLHSSDFLSAFSRRRWLSPIGSFVD